MALVLRVLRWTAGLRCGGGLGVRSLTTKAASFFLGAGFATGESFEVILGDDISEIVSFFCIYYGLTEDTWGPLVPTTDAALGWNTAGFGCFLAGTTTSLWLPCKFYSKILGANFFAPGFLTGPSSLTCEMFCSNIAARPLTLPAFLYSTILCDRILFLK